MHLYLLIMGYPWYQQQLAQPNPHSYIYTTNSRVTPYKYNVPVLNRERAEQQINLDALVAQFCRKNILDITLVGVCRQSILFVARCGCLLGVATWSPGRRKQTRGWIRLTCHEDTMSRWRCSMHVGMNNRILSCLSIQCCSCMCS